MAAPASHALALSLTIIALTVVRSDDVVFAQDSKSTELPEITVTSPSPIVKRRSIAVPPVRTVRSTRARPGRNAAPPATAQPAPVVAMATEPGVLPVVTDQFLNRDRGAE